MAAHQAVNRAVRPPPKMTISEWADAHRKLSSESSAEPGQWLTSRAEYQRGILDALNEPGVERVVIMSSAQVGKTELINNVVGYHIAYDPSPILVLQPTLEMGETWSKDRLAPMLRDTPCLRDKVADPKSKTSGNTLLHKKFNGGHVTIVGANSSAGLASRPIRIVLADEVDRYPPSAGTEGSPLSLAIKRTQTFWNRRIVVVSTPTIEGLSNIAAEYDLSDQRRYFCECPHCSHSQTLKWRQVRWPEGKPHEAAYFCEECGAVWTDADRRRAVKNGEWRATVEGRGRVAGFHLNELYSPWSTPAEMARSFLEAKGNPETLKTWINTSLGEVWRADADRVDPQSVAARAEDWGDKAPQPILIVTAAVDVQADRLECGIYGWTTGEESWMLGHHILYGDPASPQVWADLDGLLNEPVIREDGAQIPIKIALVDSGAFTSFVYDFCKTRWPKVRAIKGSDNGPVWPQRSSKNNRGRVNLFMVGTVSAKDTVYARLKMDVAGPGYVHFPKGLDPSFYDQLTSEEVETKYLRGFPKRVYTIAPGRRNEALDIAAYNVAAIKALNVRWGDIAAADQAREHKSRPIVKSIEIDPVEAPKQTKPATRPKNWINRRRGWI